MSSENNALQQARALLDELTEAARQKNIIPARLPGQLEAIGALLNQATEEMQQSASKNNTGVESPDMEAFLKDHAAFISHAIHELRTPMTSIRGYSDMLNTPSMGSLNDMQKQFLDTVRTNARRMEGLLTDVSDISKIRGGTLRLVPKMDMFKNVAMRIEKQLAPMAQETGRKLIFDIPQGLPMLNLDGETLAKALIKLVENGLRYTPAEGGEVIVSAAGQGNKLQIQIKDNGIGMTPEEIEQLGTIYFRADNDIVRSHKGSGLGVPIAFGIIKSLEGTISVESEPEKGTTFTITLPGMT
jgi:signal transduction histidine kinase